MIKLSNLFLLVAPSNCSEGKIRLVEGETDKEGDVQICHDGMWGYICGNNWTGEETRVLCQQLKYSTSCERLYFKETKEV